MIVHALRMELCSLAEQTVKVVPNGPDCVAELKGIHMEANAGTGALTLTASNIEASIRSSIFASVEETGSVIVPRIFCDILTKLPEDTVTIETLDHKQLRISSGHAQFCLPVLPGEQYPMPEMPYPEDSVSISGICTLVRNTLFAVSDDRNTPVYTCIKLSLSKDGLRGIGCNGYCVAEAKGDESCTGEVTMLLPARAMRILASISKDTDVYEVSLAGKNVVFWDGVLLFSIRLMEGEYLDTDRVFQGLVPRYTVQVEAEKVMQAVRYVASLAENEGRLEVSFGAQGLILSCQSEVGQAKAPVDAAVASAPDRPFYYNPKMLLNCLRPFHGPTNLEFSAEGHLVIKNGSNRCILMTVRAPKVKQAQGTSGADSSGKKTRSKRAA